MEIGALALDEVGRGFVGRFWRSDGSRRGTPVGEREGPGRADKRKEGTAKPEKKKSKWGKKREEEEEESSDEEFWCVGPTNAADSDMLVRPGEIFKERPVSKLSKREQEEVKPISPLKDQLNPLPPSSLPPPFPPPSHSPPPPPSRSSPNSRESMWEDDLRTTMYAPPTSEVHAYVPQLTEPFPPALAKLARERSQKVEISSNTSSLPAPSSSRDFIRPLKVNVEDKLKRWSERYSRGGGGRRDSIKKGHERDKERGHMPGLMEMVETALKRRTSFYEFWDDVLPDDGKERE